jgi:HK97 family phage major capsid protein
MATLKEAQDKVRELSRKGIEVVDSTSMTPAEQKSALDALDADIKHWSEEVQSLQFVADKRKSFAAASGQSIEDAAGDNQVDQTAAKSIGEQFIQSAEYRGLAGRMKGGAWSSGPIEIKTTFSEGTAGTPGPGYSPVSAVPQLLPGIVDIRFRQLLIADLFPQGVANTPLIRYLVESSLTNAAATVAEGGLKPESALAFTAKDETLKKIATFLPITDEMLEDWAQAQSYINQRLTLFVKQTEEVQLLSGDGTGSNLLGLLNRTGLATSIAKGTSPSLSGDNDMDAIFRQITAIRFSSFLEPDAIVIDPTAWQTITLSKNSQGSYYANGPFMDVQNPSLWGRRVVVTPAITAGTALVGAFQQGGQIFRKGGLTVEASNSHSDFFQRNLTALRAEERLGLAVYRPSAFGTVTNL